MPIDNAVLVTISQRLLLTMIRNAEFIVSLDTYP